MTIKLRDLFDDNQFEFKTGKFVAFGCYRSRWEYDVKWAWDAQSLSKITELMSRKSTTVDFSGSVAMVGRY